MSISASKHTEGNFSILALHFDREVPYTVREMEGGSEMRLSLPNSRTDGEVAAELSALRNAFINSVRLRADKEALVLDFKFTRPMKPVVWETRNPFSLVLDISPAEKTRTESGSRTAAPEKSSSNDKPVFVPAGARASASKKESRKQKSSGEISPQLQGKSEAARKNPGSPEAHFQRGLTLRHQDQFVEALEQFQQARKDPSLFIKSTTEIAAIYRQLGRSGDEIAEWEELFRALKAEGYRPKATSKTEARWKPEEVLTEEHQPSAEQKPASGIGAGVLPYIFCAVVVLLLGIIAWLYRARNELQRMITALTEGEDSAETEPAVEPEVESASEEPPPPPPQEKTEDQEPPPEVEEEPARPAEETAQEVFSLSEQGLSVQEIAEKLSLGQDEVRLILNLQREEKVPAEIV